MPLFHEHGRPPFEVPVETLVIAGWAARDRSAVEAHIRELQEIGVPPPSTVPCFYRVSAANLTTASSIQVLGTDSSGEAEVVVLATAEGLLVTVGSDHTDRKVETYSVAVSKQVCAKPVAPEVWRFEEVADHWDRLTLRAYATIDGRRVVYQEGSVDALLSPRELFEKFTGADRSLPPGTAMLCGTLTAIGGVRPAERFEMELIDPVGDRRITHGYDVVTLPVVA